MQLPQEFLQRMARLMGGAIFAYDDAPLYRGLRVNTLKCDADTLRRVLPFPLCPVPFCSDGFAVPPDVRVGSDPLHHAGAYYMQEPSAMSAVTALAPKPHEWILDLCAAPGGKSTQIAAALGGTGLLWCNEYVRSRATPLLQNLERCGVRNAVVTALDADTLCTALAGQFDAVLADLPCSGEGMFRKEPAALDGWSLDNIALCAARGAGILDAAACAVKTGGRMLVSTCTFAPEENEGQLAAFLARHPDWSIEPLALPFGRAAFSWDAVAPFVDGVPRAEGLDGCRRIFPADGGEGHFLALLRKHGDAPSRGKPYTPSGDKAARDAADAIAEWVALPQDAALARFGERWYLLPPALPAFERLHPLRVGVPAAEIAKGRLEPTHALFAAYGGAARQVVSLSADDPRTAAFLRGEPIAADGKGYAAVCVEGVPLGFGKVSNGILKNHYPKGLRVLG